MFGDLLTPMSAGQIDAESRRAAMAEVNAAAAGIGGSMSNLRQRQQQIMAGLGGLAQSVGGLSQTVGPGIAATYNQAAQTQGGLASGFSGQLRETVGNQAAQDAAFLESVVGAPQGQVTNVNPSAGGDAGNVLMGLGGLLPATMLGTQGAAFGSYGATLPATIAGMAQQDAADITRQFSSQLAELASQQAAIAAEMPAIQAEHRARLEAANMEKAAMAREMYESDRRFQLDMMAAEQAMLALGMDQKQIDAEMARWEIERQDEIDRFNAEMGYQQGRDEVSDAQWQAEFDAAQAGDQADARADRSERTAKMRAARVDLADAARVYADDLRVERTRRVRDPDARVPNPDGTWPTIEEKYRVKPSWKVAMRELRKQYVHQIRELRRMGVRKTRINKILSDALVRAGYKRPRRTRPVRPGDLRPAGTPGP